MNILGSFSSFFNRAPAKVAESNAPAGGNSLTGRLENYNKYRQNHNPARGLTMERAARLIEAYPRGEYADLMWTFGAPYTGIECADEDLLALIERRTAALTEMDWNVLTVDRDGIEVGLAREQTAYVSEMIDGIDNFNEAIEHFELAAFRGFSLAEIVENEAGDPTRLACVDHWNIVRDGFKGAWKYNPEARFTSFQSLPDANLIDPAHWVIHQVARPIGRIALVKFIRQNMCQKDWDAFIEIYGIPSGIVIGPPNVPTDKEAEYQSAAREISRGGSGYLPNGSDYKANDQPRGADPFEPRLKYLQAQMILAGTGGKLTMLNDATGIGGSQGDKHADTFQSIARARAKKISECIHKQLVAPCLAKKFPGRPSLVYWTMAYREEVAAGEVIEHAVKLSQAGYQMDSDELSEKTGYKLELKTQAMPKGRQQVDENGDPVNAPGSPEDDADPATIANRQQNDSAMLCNADATVLENDRHAQFIAAALDRLAAMDVSSLAPILEQGNQLLSLPEDQFMDGMKKFNADLPGYLKDDPAALAVWQEIVGTSWVEGYAQAQ